MVLISGFIAVPPENQQQHPDDGCDDTAYDQHRHARGVAAEGRYEFVLYAVLKGQTIDQRPYAHQAQEHSENLFQVHG